MPRLTSIVPLCLLATAGCSEAPRIPFPPPARPRTGLYVDVAGSSEGSGAPDSPWDIWTAFRGAGGRVQPGDTIWLRAGTYGGSFAVSVAGTAGAPIVVRGFP